MLRLLVCSLLLVGVFLVGTSCSQVSELSQSGVQDLLASAGGGSGLDTNTIVAGLKEALQVGTRSAVQTTSKPNGFLGNQLIRIAAPSELRTMTDALRKVGLGSKVDEFEVSMNRAAERAAGEATQVFFDAIAQMTIADARRILDGDDTAATQYFRRMTTAPLSARFTPIVDSKMHEVGLNRIYGDLKSRYNAIPLVPQLTFDLTQYVVQETLDGLFLMVGEEEKRIRRDPAARVTELLRRVFGS